MELNTHRFNNPDKGAVTYAIVHRALWEFLVAVDTIEDESEQEKLRREIFERLVAIPICILYHDNSLSVAKMF